MLKQLCVLSNCILIQIPQDGVKALGYLAQHQLFDQVNERNTFYHFIHLEIIQNFGWLWKNKHFLQFWPKHHFEQYWLFSPNFPTQVNTVSGLNFT